MANVKWKPMKSIYKEISDNDRNIIILKLRGREK